MNAITVLTPCTEHWALPSLADDIRVAVMEAESHARGAMTSALHAGELLVQAKGYLQHGQWETWLAANCPLSFRTAQAYMRLFKRIELLPEEEAQRVADLPIREAINAISTKPGAAKPATARRERLADISISECKDRDRIVAAIRLSTNRLNKAAKTIQNLTVIKGKDVAEVKRRLLEALAQIEELEHSGDDLSEAA